MLDVKNVIQAINKALKPFFIKGEGGRFFLENVKSSNNIFRLRYTEDSTNAFNDYGNEGESVNVVKWFSDFWLFVEISINPIEEVVILDKKQKEFIKGINYNRKTHLKISVSVFQGEELDDSKNQLFRAEWDDYGDGNMNHPQPHWHFLSNKAIENTVSSFADIVSDDINIKDTFEEVLKEEKSKTIDLSKFHFAMNGDWNNTSLHIHSVNNENSLAQWFGGLLAYLKFELEYINNKRRGA